MLADTARVTNVRIIIIINVFYVHENCKFLIFKLSKVMQQHT